MPYPTAFPTISKSDIVLQMGQTYSLSSLLHVNDAIGNTGDQVAYVGLELLLGDIKPGNFGYEYSLTGYKADPYSYYGYTVSGSWTYPFGDYASGTITIDPTNKNTTSTSISGYLMLEYLSNDISPGYYGYAQSFSIQFSISSNSALFSTGSEKVDFNKLSDDQLKIIATKVDLYHGLGGNDIVLLPDVATAASSGFVVGTPFITGDTVGQTYTITGGNGADLIQLGAGTDTIYGSPGNDTVTGGSGRNTFDYTSGRFANFSGFASTGTAQTINSSAHSFQTDYSKQGVIILPGSADKYAFGTSPYMLSDSPKIGGGNWASTHTFINTRAGSKLASVHLDTQGVERVQFANPLSNPVTLTNGSLYAEAAKLAIEAYADTASAVTRGWHAVSAIELGIKPFSEAGEAIQYNFEDGLYRAISPVRNGAEQDATVLTGVVNGKQTLAISFRGTDSGSDILDDFPFDNAFAKLAPLVTAVLSYVQPAGIQKILVDGHSLGGSLAQLFTYYTSSVKAAGDVQTFTFGSPGAGIGRDGAQTTNFIHTLDGVPVLGAAKGDADVGGQVYIHSQVAGINPFGDQHDKAIYSSDVNRIIDFADDPFSALFNTALGKSLASNIAYVGAPVQVMPGTDASDTMYAAAADNYVLGGAGSDRITLTSGNVFATGTGHQRAIDGGLGQDTLDIASLSSLFKLTVSDQAHYSITSFDGLQVADVTSVEHLHFLNGDVSLSGQGAASQVYALYDGLLGRPADVGGLSSYVASLNNGAAIHDIASAFLASPEGQARTGAADNAAFVEQLYQANLHRASDAGGKAGWVSTLDHGMSRADVALGFALSDEHLGNLKSVFDAGIFVPDANAANVARLYYGILDRAPDADGLQANTAAVAAGTSLHDAATNFLASGEYKQVSTGLTDAQFVDAMYGQILGRSGDAGGIQGWNSYLDHAGTRGAVINGFTDSFEFQGQYSGQNSAAYVEGLYEHILARTGDSNGLSGWASMLDNHTLSRTDVAHAFTGSSEFQAKYVAPSDAGFVDSLYDNAMGRHADAGGLQAWTAALAHGTSRADVAVSIAESLEAQQHLVSSIEAGWHLA